eukprot:6491906-Amphidinium_carterae.2
MQEHHKMLGLKVMASQLLKTVLTATSANAMKVFAIRLENNAFEVKTTTRVQLKKAFISVAN